MKIIWTIILSILLPFSFFAQSNQDCINAIPVCQNTYAFANAFTGQGSIINEINPANSCLSGEVNDVWFSFTVENTGKLRFVITPNATTDDYNWALFDITGKACSDIFTTNLEVACNVSTDVLGANNDANGRTGANSNPPFYGDLGFVFPAFIGDITVTAGKTYVLNVSNQTGSANGFSIDFGNSTATLFNPATPAFSFISPVTCGDNELIVHFNKPILCDSLQPSDFLLGGYSVTNISSNDCNVLNKNSSSTFTLTLSTPIVNSGSFALNLIGNIVDACGNTNNSDAVSFNVAPITALAGNDYTFCTGDDIFIQLGDLTASYPNNLNFEWTSSSPLVQSAISNSNSSVPMITLVNIPIDTVELVFTVSSGSCIDRDTAYLYFRDCCKDYDAQITSFTNVSCFGASTGDAVATAVGSLSGFNTGTFTYQWSNNNNTFSTSGLVANVNYTVTVTDQLGCSDTASILLSEPASPISSSTTGSVLACFGDSTGTINLNVSGATPPYTYSWSNGTNSQNLTNLTANNYIVTITDANNCTITNAEQVTQPATPITINGTASTIACGATTGQINISVNGGGSPYQYAWSNNATSKNIGSLMPGTYTVTVSDVYGCDVPKPFTVNTLTNLTATTTSTNAACASSATGSATVNVTGGLSPYTYSWSNNLTTATINNLSAGLYTVTISDATNCEIVASATVDVDATILIFGTVNPPSCFGGNDGSITTSIVANSTSILSYQWSNTTQITQNITNITAGNYTLTAMDQNGCSSSETFIVTQPTALNASATATNVNCFGGNNGTLMASVSGGTSPYNYQWSNGLGITPSVSGVAAGTYTITITDAKNCSTTASATINQPTAISATLTPTNVACANASTGSISVVPSGGTLPYNYTWNNGIGNIQNPTNLPAGTYNLTITDANNCNFMTSTTITQSVAMAVSPITVVDVSCFGGNNGSISLNIQNGIAPFSFNWTGGIGNIQNPTNLIAGTYNVTITDGNGCTATTSATINQPISALAATTTNDVLACNGDINGQITVNATGGTAPYSYNWNNGIGAIQNPSNLGAGTYIVTITDFKNCSITATAIISEPATLTAIGTGSTLGCLNGNNGTISVIASGGTAPYSYLWSNNAGTNSTASNLALGTYTVTITDANNCTVTANATVNQGATIGLLLTPTGVSCNGSTDGSIIATPSGGVAPYSYNWSDPTIGNTANAQNLSGGTYSVTVTDANGCTFTNATNVSEPTAMSFIIANQIASSCNQNNGLIVVFASGGTAPYTYQWSANANVSGNSNTAVGLGAGTYHVTVTDGTGCSQSINNIIFNSSPFFQITTSTTSPLCQTNNGEIVINAPSNYTYQWAGNGNTSNIANNLEAGNYQVTVTNNGCDTIINLTLNTPNLINASYQITDANCGQTNGGITATINAGIAPYSFAWSISPDPGNVNTVSNLASGTYFVTITDGNGCTDKDTITVNGTGSLDVQTIVNQPTCSDLGIITLNPLQGNMPYTYTWSSNANTGNDPIADNLPDGNYDVTITDAGNCQQTFSFSLSTEGLFDISLEHITENDCPNETNGAIDISTNSLSTVLNYQWSNQKTTEDVSDLPNGNYEVTVTDPFTGCSETGNYSISGPSDFTVEVPTLINIVAGEAVEITATSDANLIYSWAGNNGSIVAGPTINVSPEQTSIYTLSASLINCEPRIYPVTVQVQVDKEIIIPEAFSPNGDGVNDEFFIFPKAGIEIVSFQIFNRWGEMMHGKEGISAWNGKYRNSKMSNGAYIYLINYKIAGEEQEPLKGQFLLIR